MIPVDGNPLEVITVLQELEEIHAVMKDQIFHREPVEESPATPETADLAVSHL